MKPRVNYFGFGPVTAEHLFLAVAFREIILQCQFIADRLPRPVRQFDTTLRDRYDLQVVDLCIGMNLRVDGQNPAIGT